MQSDIDKKLLKKLQERIEQLESGKLISDKQLNIGLSASFFLNNLEFAKKYIDAGAKCQSKDMFLPISQNQIEILKLQIQHGVNLNEAIEINESNMSAIYWASAYDNIEIAKLLVQNDANTNLNGTLDDTALMKAIKNQNYDMVKLLVEYDADINQKCEKQSPLLFAIILCTIDMDEKKLTTKKNRIKIVKVLVENGANVNERIDDESKTTPLMWMIEDENLEMIKLLIKYRANVNVKDSFGQTALRKAVKQENYKIAELLIKNGADVNEKLNDITLLAITIMSQKNDIAELLIKNGADVNEKVNDVSLLAFTILSNQNNLTELLIKNGADVNEKLNDITLLAITIMSQKNDIAELLIKNGADVNGKVNDASLLAIAILFDSNNVAELLIKNGADVNEKILLAFAIIYNKNNIAELLIKKGSEINHMLFIVALIQDNQNLVQYILENGTDINKKDEDGYTLLQYIIIEDFQNIQEKRKLKNSMKEEEKKLNEVKNKINTENKIVQSDIQVKIANNENKIKEIIETNDLSKYVNLNNCLDNLSIYLNNIMLAFNDSVKDILSAMKNQMANLFIADKLELIQTVIKYGADLNIVNHKGETALDIAESIDDIEIIDELENHGATRNLTLNRPRKLVKILKNFTSPDSKPIRYTTHSWDFGGFEKEYGSFKNFMKEVKSQWENIKDELKELSPNLYEKVNTFLWETDDTKALGWSSIKGLDKWSNDGKKPHDYKVNDKIFGDIITNFKHHIEIRKENDKLEDIFIQERKRLKKQFPKKFKIKHIKLKGKTFYTDVEKFKNGLARIYEGIIEFSKKDDDILYPNIEVEAIEDCDSRYVELHITHIDSFTYSNAKNMLKEIEDGSFINIKQNFNNLCDWSIQNSYEDENYQVNYLRSENIQEIVLLDQKPKGFTHILRFFK